MFKSRAVGLGTWRQQLVARAMKICSCMSREYRVFLLDLDPIADAVFVCSGPDPKMVEKAKELCEDLLGKVREEYEEFKNRPPRNYGGSGSYGDRQGGHSSSYQGYGSYNSPARGGGSSASPPPGGSSSGSGDYAAQYAQYYGGQDPYAPYGGYAA